MVINNSLQNGIFQDLENVRHFVSCSQQMVLVYHKRQIYWAWWCWEVQFCFALLFKLDNTHLYILWVQCV